MKKIIIAAIMLFSLNVGVQAQSVVKRGNTFTQVSNKGGKSGGKETKTQYTFKDSKGNVVDMTKPEDINGYLTYKNNRTNVTGDFQIRVKAKISYGFGWYDTDWIYIDVAKTIGSQND